MPRCLVTAGAREACRSHLRVAAHSQQCPRSVRHGGTLKLLGPGASSARAGLLASVSWWEGGESCPPNPQGGSLTSCSHRCPLTCFDRKGSLSIWEQTCHLATFCCWAEYLVTLLSQAWGIPRLLGPKHPGPPPPPFRGLSGCLRLCPPGGHSRRQAPCPGPRPHCSYLTWLDCGSNPGLLTHVPRAFFAP